MSAFSPKQWQEISPYLDHALLLSEQERVKWLVDFRAQHPDLANLVKQLLDEHRALSQEHFMEGQPQKPSNEDAFIGETVGAYRLISRIGEGGMGNVWLAERTDGRFERMVAVKFLNFAVASQGAAERFKREGRVLGQLRHPHVAELIDAGVTVKGEPYLVLEYVKGTQIDEHCDEHKLGVDARIELFLNVLGAVAHAHANLVVHRDIKPSNVLVSSEGEVKLLDFGIAKLLDDDTGYSAATQLTLDGAGAMTPLFAAPEQVSGGTISTATDVYGLGVLLYVLLTGVHPAGRGPHSPADLVKSITETDAPLASQAIVLEKDATSAEKRSATLERIRRRLHGDLDTILAKALKKKPEERYVSVGALGDDLRRYLRHEPITARPDAISYRVRKYARRHRVGVALAAGLALLLVGFSVVQAVELRRIRRERDRADRIANFMTGIFKASDPNERTGSVTARELLDRAAPEITSRLKNDPEVQARLMHVMGRAYLNMGLYRPAESLFERALQAGRSFGGEQDREALRTMHDLAWAMQQEGRLAEAEDIERRLLATQRRVLGAKDDDTVATMGELAFTLCQEGQAKCGEGVQLNEQVLEEQKRLLGPQASDTLVTMDNLAIMLAQSGRPADAEKLEREALEIHLRAFGRENFSTLIAMDNLGDFQRDQGKDDEALQTLRQTLALDLHALGPNQVATTSTEYDLASVLARKGEKREALTLLKQALDHGLPPLAAQGLASDPLFASLHGDSRFAALVELARQKASPAPQSPN